MPAASLHRRLVSVGVGIVVVSAVVLDVVLFVTLRSELAGAALGKLVVIEVVATLLAAGLAGVLLHRVTEVVLRPLEKMLDVVRRQTAGHRGERLRPQSCECLLGVLGRAYDEMVDAQDAALAESQAARDRSRRFLADAAHQIRTPIAGIQACAETLLRRSRSADPDEERLLSEMLHETSSAGRLVSDLLQAARLDQGVHLEPTPCDVVALCRREVERIQCLEPVLEVTTEALGCNGERPLLDARALHDIVANLLDNARRHAISRVAVTVRRGEGSVEVHVADDGPGLSPELAERVFERFVSLDGQGGSGLGLSIAQELARAHGGDLRYQGSGFVVSLPWVPEPASGEVDNSSARALLR
ncbi:MAG TPA: HAMP domain-containing sensor histidine kinase [Acidimicrobiales bacterium]|nr:HAMP domain-containing sensor histidine kinase [Acidimicrobiales bacterium]